MEKVTINVTDKFEAKINVIEKSCNMSTLSLVKLTSKLQAQKQQSLIRNPKKFEGTFQAKSKGKGGALNG